MELEYQEAITFFQKYPDQWKKLMAGILSKRNQGFEESQEALYNPQMVDRKEVAIGIMHRMTSFDDILRDFSCEYELPDGNESQ